MLPGGRGAEVVTSSARRAGTYQEQVLHLTIRVMERSERKSFVQLKETSRLYWGHPKHLTIGISVEAFFVF